eukprot:1718494-Rhodomonas_salina.2
MEGGRLLTCVRAGLLLRAQCSLPGSWYQISTSVPDNPSLRRSMIDQSRTFRSKCGNRLGCYPWSGGRYVQSAIGQSKPW